MGCRSQFQVLQRRLNSTIACSQLQRVGQVVGKQRNLCRAGPLGPLSLGEPTKALRQPAEDVIIQGDLPCSHGSHGAVYRVEPARVVLLPFHMTAPET